MMFRNLLLTMNLLILSACPSDLFGGFIVTLGTTPLTNDSPDARLPIYVRWDGTGANPLMRGIRLSAAIGDATANQNGTPPFRVGGLSGDTILFVNNLLTGTTVWQAFGSTFSGGLPSPTNSYVIPNPFVNNGFGNPPASTHQFSTTDELVAEFRINTSGIANQRFDFNIGQLDVTTSSALLGFDLNNHNISFSGTFDVGNVSAVPEPGSVTLAMLACAGVGVAKRLRGRSRRAG